ncbi:nucleotide sugar dehydrogenase [Gammaproteobacteria bacterium]|nr:nucleotide sugar dehydrogenase [Gammaproteobacteria bacterium]
MSSKTLIDKVRAGEACVAVMGLGYVGLPLLVSYAAKGLHVIGYDIDQAKLATLGEGQSYLEHIDIAPLSDALDNDRARLTADANELANADAIILAVPTPLGKNREPDLSFIRNSLDAIAPVLRAGQLVSLESTTYPGTTEEVVRPIVEASGLVVGENVFVAYSPEREDPGNPHFQSTEIPKICSGVTPQCLDVAMAVYQQVFTTVHPVASTAIAEMAKLLENTYRLINIALVNELKVVADGMGIDIFEVIRAAATKPFGFQAFWPGPGLGGHCIPIDPVYLSWRAREYGVDTRFIELADDVNRAMPDYVVRKLMEELNHQGKPVNGSSILLLGLAYKENVGDLRESPALRIMERLQALGAVVSYADPHVAEIPPLRDHKLYGRSSDLTDEFLKAQDAVVVLAAHAAFEWKQIERCSQLIVDTRGIYAPVPNRIVRA